MATKCIVSSVVLFSLASAASAATFSIPAANGILTPTFRNQPNTTYFGWGSGSFDGATDNELIDSPATTLGGAAGAKLVQNHALDILSSTNNIYTGGNTLDLTITSPTAGTVGTGFTTLILQGKAAFGAFGTDPVFPSVNGVAPSAVVGTNATGAGQFWAKYELPGNAATYDVQLTGGVALSINTLTVDTLWSATGYSADVAVVPEPSLLGAVAGACLLVSRRRFV